MLDLELLRSFVSVVDTGGFTRAGERVHRTQSTVSQQIRRLEETLGYPLLHRNGKSATPTEQGERLLSYARRILSLEQEARDSLAQPSGEGIIRLGLPEDFAAYRLTELLSNFMRSRPGLRLDVRSGLSVQSRRALERGELDLALYKRDAGERGGIASWPEQLRWVTSRKHPIDFDRDPVPLAMSEQGCLYRNRMIHAMESAGRAWHMAYTSPSLLGIQAAVSVGLGISILPEVAILPDHRVLKPSDGFPPITNTEVALVALVDALDG
jgi:DNA-binding transcriptional LysR family regulator